MISEEKLKEMIDKLNKYLEGSFELKTLDSSIIGFINSNDRVPVEYNIKHLLTYILTGKYQLNNCRDDWNLDKPYLTKDDIIEILQKK